MIALHRERLINASVKVPPIAAVLPIRQAIKGNEMSMRIDYTNVAPAGIKALGGVYAYVLQCGLSETLFQLVYLRVSQINGCAYCLDLHTRDLIKKGVKAEKLALVQVWREAGEVFDERERAAFQWAETVTRVADTAVPDDEFHDVSTVFSEKEIVDLTIAIGLMNTFNRIGISFRRPPEATLAARRQAST